MLNDLLKVSWQQHIRPILASLSGAQHVFIQTFFSRLFAAFFVSVFMLFLLAGCQGDKNQVLIFREKGTA